MATYAPKICGTNGRMVAVASVLSGAPTTIYTVGTDTEEVYANACNIHTAEILLTINTGGTSNSDKIMRYLPPMSGPVPILEGHRMNGGVVISAYLDGNASKVNIMVDANVIT